MVGTILNQDNIEKGREVIADLVARFDSNKSFYTTSKLYKEEEAKVEFINPMMEALGWDVHNKQGLGPNFKEVVFEESLAVGKETRAPDYSFRLGGQLIYYLEAKKPSVNIKDDRSPAYQARRYGWSAKIPIVILTDFEELAIYETTSKPKEHERASTNRVLFYTYDEYVDKWEEIYGLFSKEAVLKELFQKFVDDNTSKTKKGTQSIDEEFLKDIEKWRLLLARNIALRNKELSLSELNLAVQLIIDRIVFFRMAEDRGIERYQTLYKLAESENIYKQLCEVFKKADLKYNSGLFHFSITPDYSEFVDNITLHLTIDDGVFKEIFADLYYPKSPYEFSVISPEILGNIYENFLGSVIRLTPSHQAKIEQKPEVKKAGGVFYTPQYIADYIVDKTVGKLIKGKTPNQISKLKIVDPACGSGSFLLRAYQKLLDYHLEYYISMERPPKEVYYVGKDNIPRLTIREKKRILTNNIYGVDIDVNAVEVTKLSLLLKVLEDENKDVLEQQQKLYQEKVLPNLSYNIKCGNSLIGTDILEQEDLEYDELVGLNPFDWEREFPLIFSNGGFNAVIGNPPYVFGGNKGITKLEKKYLKNKYQSGSGKINLFTLFMEKGVNILKESGLLSFIIPNTLLRVTSYKNIRKFLVDNVTINEITDLSSGIFKGVTTSSIIFTFSNNPSKLNNFVSIKKDLSNNLYNQVKQKDFTNHGFIYNIFCKPHERIIINKLKENSISLGEISKYLRFGVVISKNKDELISFNKIDDQYKPFLEGKEIDRYSIDYKGRYIKYVPKLIHRPRTVDLFESEKIMIQRISGGNKPIKSAYDDGYFYNKESIINFVIKSDKFYIKYVLALLNSNLINWYYSKEFSNESKLTVNLSKEYLSDIPIKNISLDEQIMFVELVDKIIDIKNRIKSCKTPQEDKLLNVQLTKIDEQINIKIYELYDLNNEEINIIENSFTK
ncbi:Eco57I restriction-modification methylase domain-containing protein [uncultured Methanobrevibacter sp.]|uniref:Eco57I restriction-modification methylase domain-containing protein n=1 Tax=Methanobrevibacter sp. TaxID=66852 RepID=UPI00320930E2